MLYIDDDARALWPGVARTLASLLPLDMVLCLYPGQDPEELPEGFNLAPIPEALERVAEYTQGEAAPSCGRVALDEALLGWLEPRTDEFEDWCDSLALYRPGRTELVAALIPHQGVILIADEFGSAIAAAGFRASEDTPEGLSRD